MLTLTNSFHGTKIEVRKSENDLAKIEEQYATGRIGSAEKKAADRFIRKCRKTLCGIEGCTCGDLFGRRG